LAVSVAQSSGKDGGGKREEGHDHQQQLVEEQYDSVLMEDLRVEVALDFDPVAKQRGEDDAVDRERLAFALEVFGCRLLVGSPLNPMIASACVSPLAVSG
jgi:hypothetical protein